MRVVIEARDLTKSYGAVTAVKKIGFAIKQGEIFGFLGPNGAGKTSTINMMTGLARITAGSIRIDGTDVAENPKRVQAVIGVVPDESNLYDEMDGFDNLCFCAALYGLDRGVREERAAALLEQFGLADVGRRPFRAYSKGMKRKLTIAAALIHEPSVLFLDEPTTGIDVDSARGIRQLIAELNRAGTTVFLTTHYIEEAERLCDRIAFIVAGEIAAEGSVAELIAQGQQQTTVELTVSQRAGEVAEAMRPDFPAYTVDVVDDCTLRIASSAITDLTSLVGYLEEREAALYEAKILRPSLEDIFVRVTGLDSTKLEQGKGRG